LIEKKRTGWRLPLLVLTVALLALLAACNSDDQTPERNNNQSDATAPPADQGPQPVVTRIVTRTPTPFITPTITPTLSFPAWRVGGDWALILRYDVVEGALVDQLTYSGNATISIGEDGSVSGFGSLVATPLDVLCTTVALDSEPYRFAIEGSLRPEGERILLDIRLVPETYDAQERYQILCPDYLDGPREETQSLLWRMLEQTGRLRYTFPLDTSFTEVTFAEDLTQITNNVLRGTLNGDVILQRS
jgi:hypothetical protein